MTILFVDFSETFFIWAFSAASANCGNEILSGIVKYCGCDWVTELTWGIVFNIDDEDLKFHLKQWNKFVLNQIILGPQLVNSSN